ncbi:MAG TPA: hypothetical protein VFV66_22810 [Nonomuraea sp.]|nr:hypothetical protein [Nonomuraea sp.]
MSSTLIAGTVQAVHGSGVGRAEVAHPWARQAHRVTVTVPTIVASADEGHAGAVSGRG